MVPVGQRDRRGRFRLRVGDADMHVGGSAKSRVSIVDRKTSPTGLKAGPRTTRVAALLLLGTALVSAPAFAASETWNGNSSVNWNDAGNWSTAAPTNGDDVTLAQTGTNGDRKSVV